MSLLGEGSFGCVFTPKFPCDSKEKKIRKSRGEELVSKVFTQKDEFQKEIRMSKKAAKIDPSSQSVLVPISSCRVARDVVEKHPAVHQCTNLTEQSSKNPLYQLLMPYGGKRIDHVLRDWGKPCPFAAFLAMVQPLFDGLLLFEAQKMCHQDIKTGNILVTPQGKAIYIDYGLMTSYANMYSPQNQRRLKYTYFPYPPEYKIAYYLIANCNHCSILDGVKNNIAKFGETRQAAFYTYFTERELVEHAISLQQYVAKKKGALSWLKRYANRVDVYSLGMALVDASRYVHVKPGAQQDAWANLLRGMIHPDVRNRYSPKQAHNAFQKLRGLLSS